MRQSVLWFFVLLILQIQAVRSQGTEFIYQGSLNATGTPANGNYDFEFLLFDAASGGSQLGSTVALNNIPVANGIFSVRLNFGNQYSGPNRFLEIRLRPTGQAGMTILTPRQLLTSVPYSVKSLNAESANNATQLNGQPASFYQNASNLDAGTVAASHCLGRYSERTPTSTVGVSSGMQARPLGIPAVCLDRALVQAAAVSKAPRVHPPGRLTACMELAAVRAGLEFSAWLRLPAASRTAATSGARAHPEEPCLEMRPRRAAARMASGARATVRTGVAFPGGQPQQTDQISVAMSKAAAPAAAAWSV